MKKLILSVVILFTALAVKAQVGQNVIVTNNTSCDVYFILRGDPSGGCTGQWESNVMTLTAGGSVTFTAATLSCSICTPVVLTPSDDLIGAKVLDADPTLGCFATGNLIGDACYTGATTSPAYPVFDAACNPTSCTATFAVWAAGPPGTVTLDFY